MYSIVFKNGIAYAVSKEHDELVEEIPAESLIDHLNCEIELESGTLFDHVWGYIARDDELMGRIFAEAMGRHPIEPFIEQFKKPAAPREDEDPEDSMHFCELFWEVDNSRWEKDGETKKSFNVSPGFHGMGKWRYEKPDGTIEIRDQGYAVDFTLVNDLKGYELKLNNRVRIWDTTRKPVVENKILVESTKVWTVYDVIYGILFEMTFCGLPNEQIAKMAELDQRVAEAKELSEEKKLKKWPPKSCQDENETND